MESAKSSYDVVVVGGGIVGSASALALLKRGYSVMIVDESAPRTRASWGNAGHIAVEQTKPLASVGTILNAPKQLMERDGALVLPLRDIGAWLPFFARFVAAARPSAFARGNKALRSLLCEAMPAWQRYVAELQAPDLLVQNGHIIVWDSPASAAAGRAAWCKEPAAGISFRDLTPAELAQLRSLLGREPAGALYCVGSGNIAGHDLVEEAFRRRFEVLGGIYIQGRAQLNVEERSVRAIVSGVGPLSVRKVVIAGGVASRSLMESIGFVAPLIAERGYHVQAPGVRWPASLPPVVFEDRSLIVTRFRNSVRASSFVEFSRQVRPPEPRRWGQLRRRISELNLPFELPGEEWVGCRPTLPDYLPAIGRSVRHENLVYAFGHQHLGLTLGPISGEIVASLVAGDVPKIDTSFFDVERFGPWKSRREQRKSL